MLYRKIEKYIVSHLQSGSDKILIVDGARQIGKSYIIREIGKKLFPNYIEVNMETDKLGDRTFRFGVHHLQSESYQSLTVNDLRYIFLSFYTA